VSDEMILVTETLNGHQHINCALEKRRENRDDISSEGFGRILFIV
jgi:hypothetical protein